MITQKEINKYIKDIKKELLYGTKESRQFLKDLRQNVTDFAEENQGADMAEVTEQFGKPEDIAATFFEQYDKKEIKHKVNVRRVVVIIGIVMLVVISCSVAIALVDSHIDTENYEEYTLEEGTTHILNN